jgi:hypothetical protein
MLQSQLLLRGAMAVGALTSFSDRALSHQARRRSGSANIDLRPGDSALNSRPVN